MRLSLKRDTLVVCGLAFGVFLLTILFTHASGEGDSTLHYLNAREGVSRSWLVLLSSWARPLFKALIIGPAWVGMGAARLVIAVLATLLVAQTIGLARDLKLERAWFAGLLLIAQPLTFLACHDTLTEIPAALALYGALRLWLHRKYALSCLLISFIPAIRPEGYFFMALWVALALVAVRNGEAPRVVLGPLPLLGVGLLLWMAVCWWAQGTPLYPFRSFWPIGGWGYGSGHWWDYLGRWPWFMGSALFPLFLVGAVKSFRREMTLVWVLWWLVLGLHSFLWWRGLFASAGMLRIMVVIAPSSALITLVGFNAVVEWLKRKAVPSHWQTALGVAFTAWAAQVVVVRAVGDYYAQAQWVAWPVAEYLLREQLVPPGTQFFAANALMLTALDYPRTQVERVEMKYEREAELALLRGLRPGAVGVWDNGSSNKWTGVTIEDFPALGYERLAEFSDTREIADPWAMYQPWRKPNVTTLRYVVFRKREATPAEPR